METLEERVLRALMQGPKAFDDIKAELGTTDDELTDALNKLKDSHHIESIHTNGFRWSLVSMQ